MVEPGVAVDSKSESGSSPPPEASIIAWLSKPIIMRGTRLVAVDAGAHRDADDDV